MKKQPKSLIYSSASLVILLAAPSLAASETKFKLEPENTNLELLAQTREVPSATSETKFKLEPKNSSFDLLAQTREAPSATSETKFKLEPKKSSFDLLAQTREAPSVKTPNVLVPNPEIIIKSSNTPGAPNITQGTVNVPITPTLPRAVAPPVGDIAVSNINTKVEQIDLGTRAIVPRLVLRQAPAKEVLAVLARYAGLNLVFLDSGDGASDKNTATGEANAPTGGAGGEAEPTVSLDLANEPVQEVFNSVLMISGLKATRHGRTIFVGAKLPNGARNLITRTLRLNQGKASSVASFLAAQGAEVQLLITPVTEITDPVTQRVVRRVEGTPQFQALTANAGAGAPTILKGLSVLNDERLNTVTLIGEPRQIEIATSFITELDARRRQVAVNVKVIDIELNNTQSFSTSFSFGFGNNNILSQSSGTLGLNFGNGAAATGLPSNFLLSLNAQISNGNAKILTDPTLIVQEGQDASVLLTQKVLTSVTSTLSTATTTTGGTGSSIITETPVFDDAGLKLTVHIDKIDDNGFINLSVAPYIAAPSAEVSFNSGVPGANNTFTLLSIRQLSSGLIRLRDNQTLVVSGIISETDQTTISKVPILGDIPLLGALFRSTQSTNERKEVIILLTPRVLNDGADSQFGYNYTPSPTAAELLKKQDFPLPK